MTKKKNSIGPDILATLLKEHALWCADPDTGACAAFRGVILRGADFSMADLSGVDFRDAALAGANFEDATLIGTDFRCADLEGANFEGADTEGANFEGATGIAPRTAANNGDGDNR